jgi:hypothetical protein
MLVRAKSLAIITLDEEPADASKAITHLRDNLDMLVADTDVKHMPAYAPIHEGRLISRP